MKSLLNYPDVVKMMSNDLDWTSALGEAVVADQGAVLESVQVFRRQAKAAGNLKSDTKQVVKTEKEVIIIEPADPQVVYVPQYNPSTVVVYGAAPMWGYYPTPYPSYYYPYAPGAAMAAGVIWGAAIGAAWSGNHYGWGGGNDININRNTNISTGGNTINRGQGGGGQASQWKSNKQPGQVSSSVGKTAPANRAGDARGGAGASAGGGARASAQPAGGAGRTGAGAGAGAGGDRAGAGAGGGARPVDATCGRWQPGWRRRQCVRRLRLRSADVRWTVRAAPRVAVRRTVAAVVRRTVAVAVRVRRRAAVLRAAVAAAARHAAAVAVAAAAAADVDREGAKSCAHSHQSMARRHP